MAAGTPTDPTTPDTEFSTDGGATFGDCAEEVTTGGGNGIGYLTLTGAETNNNVLAIAAKSANCLTTPVILYPRVLASVGTGTLSAGSAGGGTLGTVLPYDVTGCFIQTTGGTGGGGTGGANNQARRIATYTPATGVFTVVPNWETTPDATTTYSILLPEGVTLGMLRTLNPATAGRTLVVDTNGLADANAVKVGPTGTGTAQTARDLGLALPAVASGANGGLPLLDSNLEVKASTLRTNNDKTGYTASTVSDKTGYALTSAYDPAKTAAQATDLVTAQADLTTLTGRLTSGRAGYLDNLNVGGLVASSAEATAIQNNTRVVRVVPDVLERPDAGSTAFRIELFLYDSVGNMEAPDSAPTLAVVNQSGTSRDANLDSTTMTLVSTGRYRSTYTVDAAHALEELVFAFTVTEGAVARLYGNGAQVVDTSAVDFTASDRTVLQGLATTLTAIQGGGWSTETLVAIQAAINLRLLTSAYTAPDNATLATIDTKLGTPAASVSADIAAVKTDTGNLLTRITAPLFAGITSLKEWLGLLGGKQSADSTARTELRATGAGSGTYDETTDSLEALRDRGDTAWIGSTPPTVTEIRAEMDANSTKLANLTGPAALETTAQAIQAAVDALPAAMDIDTQLSGTHGAGSWEGGGGGGTLYGESGSVLYTYTVTDIDTVTPLSGVSVYVSADEDGEQRSQAKLTDALGRVQFQLDPGTAWFWRSHPLRTFTDPDEEEIG